MTKRPVFPNLARQFDLMAKGCRSLGLGSWEDDFDQLRQQANSGEITVDQVAEVIDYDYRNDAGGRAALDQILSGLLADARLVHGEKTPQKMTETKNG